MQNNREKLFEQIAALYAEREGAALRAELEQSRDAQTPTPGLDKKLRGKMFRIKYKVYIRAGGLIAACLALALLLPPILMQQHAPAPAAVPEMAAAFALPPQMFSEEAEEALEYDASMFIERAAGEFAVGGSDAAVGPEAQAGDAALPSYFPPCDLPEPAPAAGGGIVWGEGVPVPDLQYGQQVEHEAQPVTLSFDLPDGFDLVSAYVHRSRHGSMHTLSYGQDQLIMFNIQFRGHPGVYNYFAGDVAANEWAAVELGGHILRYYRGENYTVVSFEKDSVLYDLMSMQADLETLIILSEAILGG